MTAFSADTAGDPGVAFSNGSALQCRPEERFEAWKSFADGRLSVCLPGGDVSGWARGGDLWADGDDRPPTRRRRHRLLGRQSAVRRGPPSASAPSPAAHER